MSGVESDSSAGQPGATGQPGAPRAPHPQRRVLFAAVTALLVGAVVVAVAEVALQLRELRRVQALHAGWSDFEVGFEMHPFLQIVPAPNSDKRIRVNDQRFRGDPIEVERSPGTARIFALGGSTTLSNGVAYGRTWPAQLGRALAESQPGLPVEVQNAACDWYSSAHSLVRYELSVRRFRPDVVVVFHAINDLYRSFSPEWFAVGDYRADYSHYYGPLIRAQRRSELAGAWVPFGESLVWRALRGGGGAASGAELDPERSSPFDARGKQALREGKQAVSVRDFPSLASFRENLEALVRATRADGVKLVLATQPSLFVHGLSPELEEGLHFGLSFASQNGRYPDFESLVRGMDLFNRATREVAAKHGVPVVDLARAVPPTAENFGDDVHMTGEGLKLVAAALAPAVAEALTH